MSRQVFIGVDLGAESGRVMAGLWDARVMALEETHRFPNGGVGLEGTLRWDAPRLWSEVERGLGLAASRFRNDIVSVGVDAWAIDYALLSEEGELLELPYHYRDERNRGMIEAACAITPRSEIFASSGIQFMEMNTLCQLLAHRRQSPEILRAADRLLMIPDYFHWRLSGASTAEFTNATTTQLVHPTERRWSSELIEKFELPGHLFQPLVEPGTKLGPLRREVSTRAGLGRIEVVAPAAHDTASAVAATPAAATGRPDWAYISSGTWSLLGVEIPRALLTPEALARNVTNEGGVDGTYRLLKNIMGLWLLQQCRRSFESRGLRHDYAELIRLAEAAPPLRSLVDPDDPRFLHPPDMPQAIAGFCRESGQPVPETEGALARCVLESLALKYNVVLGWIEELTGCRAEVIHIVGGGSRNALLNQFTAEACQRPVLAGPAEATVLGNVLTQARAFGEIASLTELRAAARASSEIHGFNPLNPSAWSEARARMTGLLPFG